MDRSATASEHKGNESQTHAQPFNVQVKETREKKWKGKLEEALERGLKKAEMVWEASRG